jgi:hypothetical protein
VAVASRSVRTVDRNRWEERPHVSSCVRRVRVQNERANHGHFAARVRSPSLLGDHVEPVPSEGFGDGPRAGRATSAAARQSNS